MDDNWFDIIADALEVSGSPRMFVAFAVIVIVAVLIVYFI